MAGFSVSDILDKAVDKIKQPGFAQWESIPVSFYKFCKDGNHMAFPALSAAQLNATYKILYGISYKKFSELDFQKRRKRISKIWKKGVPRYNIGIWMVGKGGGKDSLASLVICYLIYTLLLLDDPQGYFGQPTAESIDIINVAYSAEQANSVFFEKFKQRILHWPWLSARYSVKESGKYLNEVEDRGKRNSVRIGRNGILFPKFIRAFSKHSDQEASEGLNLIAWIADEIAAFSDKTKKQNGKKMFAMLRTSANSRFPGVYRGLAISYPRHEGDVIMTLHDLAKKTENMYSIKATTWEFNPTKQESDFDDEKLLDPEDYYQKYMCMPPKTLDAFFKYPEHIVGCIRPGLLPIASMEEILIEHQIVDPSSGKPTGQVKHFVGHQIIDFFLKGKDLGIPRVVHVDAGLRRDRAALVMAHGVPSKIKMFNPTSQQVEELVVNKVVEDLIVYWQPDKKRQLQVSINNIEGLILELIKYGVKIQKLSYDQWNSASALESLSRRGIHTEEHNINTEDYKLLRNMIYADAIDLLPHDLQRHELEKLQFKNGKKVDHPPESEGGSKEISDCLCGVNRLLNDFSVKKLGPKPLPRSIVGSSIKSNSGASAAFGPQSGGVTGDNPMIGHPGSPAESARSVPMQDLQFNTKSKAYVSNSQFTVTPEFRNMPRAMTSNGNGSRGLSQGRPRQLLNRIRGL